jgi:hypothetical protein
MGMRTAFVILIAALSVHHAGATNAQETAVEFQSVTVRGQDLGVFGKRISKSGTARLANLTHQGWRMGRSIYLPAGKIILVSKTCERKRDRQWCLSITEDGLPLYARTDGMHFFNVQGRTGLIAVALTNVDATTADGRSLSITPSEVYTVEKQDDATLQLVVDPSSQKGFESRSILTVKDNPLDFAVINTDDVRNPAPFEPILRVQSDEVVDILMQAITNKGLTSAQWQQLVEEGKQKFVLDTKSCTRAVKLNINLEGDIHIDAGRVFLGLIKSKLGLTGAFVSESEYPKGLEFESYRFTQQDPDHNAIRFYELWLEKQYVDNDCIDVRLTRVRAQDDAGYGGNSGSIDSNDEIGIEFPPTQALPVYHCRDEYLTLIEHLTQTDGDLPEETAALLVAYLARFDSGGDPAICPSRGTKR